MVNNFTPNLKRRSDDVTHQVVRFVGRIELQSFMQTGSLSLSWRAIVLGGLEASCAGSPIMITGPIL